MSDEDDSEAEAKMNNGAAEESPSKRQRSSRSKTPKSYAENGIKQEDADGEDIFQDATEVAATDGAADADADAMSDGGMSDFDPNYFH